jgi:hypothetical protein
MSQNGGTYHRPSSGWGRAPQPRDQEAKDGEPVIDEKTGVVDEKTALGTDTPQETISTKSLSGVDKEDRKEWVVIDNPEDEKETPIPCARGISSSFNLQLGRAQFSWEVYIRREHRHDRNPDHDSKEE